MAYYFTTISVYVCVCVFCCLCAYFIIIINVLYLIIVAVIESTNFHVVLISTIRDLS